MTNNFDELDGRLRSALPAPDSVIDADVVSDAPTRRSSFLRSTRATMTSQARRRVAVGSASVAVVALAVGSVAGQPSVNGPLIVAGDSLSGTRAYGEQLSTVSDKMMIMPWVTYVYSPGADLSTVAGRDHVYKLDRAGTPESVGSAVAEAFGVTGKVTKSSYFNAEWPSYVVGSEDGLSESVSVSWSGTANWWYSNPDAYPETVCPEVDPMADPAEGSSTESPEVVDPVMECTEIPAPYVGPMPTQSQAAQLASELWAATGYPVAAADIDVTTDEWGVTASSNLVVGGEETALNWMISWATNGAIAYATGNSVTIQDMGEFDTVSPVDAVERLDDWRWYGSPGPALSNTHMYAANSDVLRVGPELDVNGEPIPEVTNVTVDTMTPTRLMMWDGNGDAWVVPGYATLTSDDWWNTVISLVEGIIELPEPFDGPVAY